MNSKKSGPLESGSHTVRYVLLDEQLITHGHAGTLHAARQRRENLDLNRTVRVVREERHVVPDAVTPAPSAHEAADGLHVLNMMDVDGEDRVREDVLPRILTFMGDADPEDIPEYDDLPGDAGKWTTAASLALAFTDRYQGVTPVVREFRGWLESHDTTEPYDVKTIRVHEPERGRYVYVMVNRLDGRNHTLGDMGFTGVYFQFSVMSQSADFRLTRLSAYEIKRDHPTEWFPDSNAYRLIRGLDSGSVDWNALADGDQLTPEDVSELTEDGGEDE